MNIVTLSCFPFDLCHNQVHHDNFAELSMRWVDLWCHAAVCGKRHVNDQKLQTGSQAPGRRAAAPSRKGQPLQTKRQQSSSGQMAAASNMKNGRYEPHIMSEDSHLFKQAKQRKAAVMCHNCMLHNSHTGNKDGCLPARCDQSLANGACYASWPFQQPLTGQTASSMGAWLPLWPCSVPLQQSLLLPLHSPAGPEHCTCCLACVSALLHHALRTAQPHPGQFAGRLSCLKAVCKPSRPLSRALWGIWEPDCLTLTNPKWLYLCMMVVLQAEQLTVWSACSA